MKSIGQILLLSVLGCAAAAGFLGYSLSWAVNQSLQPTHHQFDILFQGSEAP